jgi:hypothetical protein
MIVWMNLHTVGMVFTGRPSDCAIIDHILNATHARQRLFRKSGIVDIDVQFFGSGSALLNKEVCLGPSAKAETLDRMGTIRRHRFRLAVEEGDMLTFSKDPYDLVVSYLP